MNDLRWGGLLLGLGLLQEFLPTVWRPLGGVDWLLIAVAHRALRSDFRRSVLLGAVAGLIQDGLSGGIVGLHGFAKTAVAAAISAFGSFIVFRGPLSEAGVTGLAAVLESVIVIGWLVMLGRPAHIATVGVVGGALATAVATAVWLTLARWLRRRIEQRRAFT